MYSNTWIACNSCVVSIMVPDRVICCNIYAFYFICCTTVCINVLLRSVTHFSRATSNMSNCVFRASKGWGYSDPSSDWIRKADIKKKKEHREGRQDCSAGNWKNQDKNLDEKEQSEYTWLSSPGTVRFVSKSWALQNKPKQVGTRSFKSQWTGVFLIVSPAWFCRKSVAFKMINVVRLILDKWWQHWRLRWHCVPLCLFFHL